jgi:hypothetical protein
MHAMATIAETLMPPAVAGEPASPAPRISGNLGVQGQHGHGFYPTGLGMNAHVGSSVTVLEVLLRPGCRPPSSLVEELFGRDQIEPLPCGQKLLLLKLSP